MEEIATESEAAALLEEAGKILVVAEERSNPIRLRRFLPAVWRTRPFEDLSRFRGRAQPGEAYSFQVGIVSIDVWFTQLVGEGVGFWTNFSTTNIEKCVGKKLRFFFCDSACLPDNFCLYPRSGWGSFKAF